MYVPISTYNFAKQTMITKSKNAISCKNSHFIISMYIAKQSENSIYRLPETIFPENKPKNS